MADTLDETDPVDHDLNDAAPNVPAYRWLDLIDANRRVSDSLEPDTVLQEVVDGACRLTSARYGAVVLLDQSGEIEATATRGVEPHQLDLLTNPPVGEGLLGYLNELGGPLRVANIPDHPRSAGVPDNHPVMESFLGAKLHHDETHIGNIYLAEKIDESEFTQVDEQIVTLFAAQSATAISNARRFEREQRTKTDLKALVQIAPVGLVVFDAKTGRVLTANQECQRMGGEVGGSVMSWQETFEKVAMFRADGRQIPATDHPTTQVLQSGETVWGEEITLRFADGRTLNTLINAAPIYSDQGDMVSVVIAIQDMALLEDSERMRAEYLGLVSHELRTPLTTIKGSLAALDNVVHAPHDSETLQLLQIIDQQTELMRNHINRLIELSYIETGALTLSLEPTDPSNLLADGIREFRQNHAGFAVEQDIPDDLPLVMVDEERMSQGLRDVFAHMSKYASDSSTLSVKVERDGQTVAFSISTGSDRANDSDTPELVEQILSASGENATQTHVGDGLALIICKGIVEAHEGRFRTRKDASGHGTICTFTLPVAATSRPDPVRYTYVHDVAERSHDDRAPRILIVSDERDTRRTLRQTLLHAGYTVGETQDLQQIRRLVADTTPQLLILDLADSAPSEFEVIRSVAANHFIRTVALIHGGDGERTALASEMGADGCLAKPISPTEVIAQIRAPLHKLGIGRLFDPDNGFAAGQLVIDYGSHRVMVSGDPVQMTATEYKLLYELSRKAGQVMTQDELLHRVWGPEYSGESQLLRAFVKSVRHKLGDNARSPSYIFTEHGVGYRMAEN